jgi:DNA repair protein RadD
MQLRDYQIEAVNSVYEHIKNKDTNPCVVLPTAAGKTPVIAQICHDVVEKWNGRVIVLAHVKELLEQAVESLQEMAPELSDHIGVYSAGLNSRETDSKIIIGGIQSVYNKAQLLGSFDVVIIDEAHLIPIEGEGMYRTFLNDLKMINANVRLIGMTATPFRMKGGSICKPENLLNEICYEIGVKELIVQGYLCKLKSKGPKNDIDTSQLHIRAGEFISDEIDLIMNNSDLVKSAAEEIIEHSKDRKSVLIFSSSIEHGNHLAKEIRRISSETIAELYGDTPSVDRAVIITDFKEFKIKYLVNMGVLTTGFNAKNIDCIALVRPTNSPGLYYQMCGRGLRTHELKQDCKILDFGGNIVRHGPIDSISFTDGKKSNKDNEAPAKKCPECLTIIHASHSNCPDCGYEFPKKDYSHSAYATDEDILSGEVTIYDAEVTEINYSVHTKKGAKPSDPKTMKVEYRIGLGHSMSEWVCFEHEGFARKKAESWWKLRSDEPTPTMSDEAVLMCKIGNNKNTKSIKIKKVSGVKYDSIIGHELEEQKEWEAIGNRATDDEIIPF